MGVLVMVVPLRVAISPILLAPILFDLRGVFGRGGVRISAAPIGWVLCAGAECEQSNGQCG